MVSASCPVTYYRTGRLTVSPPGLCVSSRCETGDWRPGSRTRRRSTWRRASDGRATSTGCRDARFRSPSSSSTSSTGSRTPCRRPTTPPKPTTNCETRRRRRVRETRLAPYSAPHVYKCGTVFDTIMGRPPAPYFFLVHVSLSKRTR